MPRNEVLVGHVLDRLRGLPADSVHCVVTSPPYWGLRAYGTEPQVWGGDPAHDHQWGEPLPGNRRGGSTNHEGRMLAGGAPAGSNEAVSRGIERGAFCSCGAWRGELGLEPSPGLYIEHLMEVFREVRRVLHPSGVLWLNLGDSYATGGNGGGGAFMEERRGWEDRVEKKGWRGPPAGLKHKDLVGIPWRVAFALQDDGWWLRCDVIWAKPNPMPESTQDRPTRAHEYVFLLTKRSVYFYDGHAIKEPFADSSLGRYELADGRARAAARPLADFGATPPIPERERERERVASTRATQDVSPAAERGSTTW